MSLHLVLALLVPYMVQTQAHVLEARAETQATCQAGFEWAENDAQDSPCSLAATVIAPCSQSGTWDIPPLNEGNHYNSPSPANNTVTDCYCSWAAYNLLNACTACQNMPDGLTTWLFFNQNCGSHESNTTYFPPNIALANNISLPFYATIDPSSWQDGRFNVQQAQGFANQPDVNPAAQSGSGTTPAPQPTSTPSQSSSPTGAIAGGVVGGIVILAVAALVAFWFIRRRRRSVSEDGMGIVKPSHGRSLSDMTQSSYPQSSYPQPSDFPYSPMPSPGFTSIHTHESGPATISRIGSIYTTPPHGNSSPTRGSTPASSMDPSLRMSVTSQNISNIGFQPMAITPETPMEEVPRPYVLNQHTVSNNNMQLNRKGPINLQYDSPNSPPVNRADEYLETSTESASRPQMNPPPYSPVEGIPSDATTPSEEVAAALRDRNGHSHRPRPAQKGSFDTESPWTSTGSRVITTMTPEPSSGQMGSPVSPIRHVVNGSVISGPDDGPEIA